MAFGKPSGSCGRLRSRRKRSGVICTGACGSVALRSPSALFTTNQVRHFHDPTLHALQFIATRWRQKQQEDIRHMRNCDRLGLTHTNRFDQHKISKPAPSHRRTTSRVRRATPPRYALTGRRADKGRADPGSDDPCASCRPGSSLPTGPSLGSTASTATRKTLRPVKSVPKLSIKVDFPTPGVPERPIGAKPVCRVAGPDNKALCLQL